LEILGSVGKTEKGRYYRTKHILEQQWLIYPMGSKESGLGVEYRMGIEYRE
jgi:hypothetical protein